MADQPASLDPNRFPGLIAHAGTEDGAETRKVITDATGALMVNIGGTEPVTLSAGTVTEVSNIAGGTISDVTITGGTLDLLTRLGNLGTLEAGTVSVSAISADIPGGTLDSVTLGTSDNNIGNIDIASITPTISTNNSSTSTLGSGATFTGSSEDVSTFASIKINVFADQASATDGLQIQFSSDDTNWDISYDFSVPANQGEVYEIGPEARYFRIVYTNGGVAQGAFRLQTIFHPVSTQHVGVPINSVVEPEDNAQLVKAVLTGENPQGTYTDIQTTTAGNLKMSVEEFEASADLPGGTVDLVTRLGNIGTIESGTVTVGSIADIGQVHNAGTVASLPDLPGGTLDSVTVTSLPDPVGSVVVTAGTSSITSLPDLPGGTVDLVSNITTGTLSDVTVTSITSDIPGGTIDLLSNITTGSLANIATLHNGTVVVSTLPTLNIASGTQQTLGTVGVVNNLATGTVAVVSSVTNLAGGTMQMGGVPPENILLFGTIGTAGAATSGTLIAAGGSGTSHYVNDLSIVVSSGTVDAMIAYGTAIVGSGVLARGQFVPSAGIQKSFSKSPGGNHANTALTWAMQGAGTVAFNVSYFTK